MVCVLGHLSVLAFDYLYTLLRLLWVGLTPDVCALTCLSACNLLSLSCVPLSQTLHGSSGPEQFQVACL